MRVIETSSSLALAGNFRGCVLRNSSARLGRLDRFAYSINDSTILEELPDRKVVEEVAAGLRKRPKEISSKWFYDETGSALFDLICDLPEYYPTRVELSIMRKNAFEIARALGPNVGLVEFGSGTSMKTRVLLDRLESPSVYVPIDIACTHLLDAASSIAREYPWLSIAPLCADFTTLATLPKRAAIAKRKVVYFPGSTIGNFETASAGRLLANMRSLVGGQGAILIGIDLKKDSQTLERAYNDSRGVTAQFNLNALRHLNRAVGSDFKLENFEHDAVWIENQSRIEMRLRSLVDQRIVIGDESIVIAAGEYIRTEMSHKYTLESFADLARSAGLAVREVWCDSANKFSVQLLEPIANTEQLERRFLSV